MHLTGQLFLPRRRATRDRQKVSVLQLYHSCTHVMFILKKAPQVHLVRDVQLSFVRNKCSETLRRISRTCELQATSLLFNLRLSGGKAHFVLLFHSSGIGHLVNR